METLKAIRTLILAFSAGVSAGELTAPLVLDTPVHRCPCTENGGVCRCPKDANGHCLCEKIPAVPVTLVAAGPKITPTPQLTPDCWLRVDNPKIHDADTLKGDVILPYGITLRAETIRASDYDAWEITRTRQSVTVNDAEIARGKKATAEFKELVEGATIYISPPLGEERDNYGRLLGKLMLIRGQECLDVAAWMKSHGHCRK